MSEADDQIRSARHRIGLAESTSPEVLDEPQEAAINALMGIGHALVAIAEMLQTEMDK
jgi:hypothetical protein